MKKDQKEKEIFEMRFTLPAGKKFNRVLLDWAAACFTVAEAQGMECELLVNGQTQTIPRATITMDPDFETEIRRRIIVKREEPN